MHVNSLVTSVGNQNVFRTFDVTNMTIGETGEVGDVMLAKRLP